MTNKQMTEKQLEALMAISLAQQAELRKKLDRRESRNRMIWSMAICGTAFWLAGYTFQGEIELLKLVPGRWLILGLLLGYILERVIYGRPD